MSRDFLVPAAVTVTRVSRGAPLPAPRPTHETCAGCHCTLVAGQCPHACGGVRVTRLDAQGAR